jgi:hypothetical protein
MTQSVFYALQFFWLGDQSTSSPFTPAFAEPTFRFSELLTCDEHWFMLVSSSLTAARPFPAFTGFSYTAIMTKAIQRFTA